MKKKLNVAWFSAGIDSFIAGYIVKDEIGKFIYIHIDDQHEDSLRFLKDCEKVYGKEIEIIQHPIYKNKNQVQRAFSFINSAFGAKCTMKLKKEVRKQWELEHKEYDITYYWGFDIKEKHRISRLKESNPEFNHRFPLIENDLSKQDCHGYSKRLGVKRPVMYDLGYSNNNCIACVKGGIGYWNKIRVDFPEAFIEQGKIEREIGHTCLKDVNGPIYLDELDPKRGRMENEIMEDCSIFCKLAINESED